MTESSAYAWRTMRVLELLAYRPLSAPRIAEALYMHPRTIRRLLSQLKHEQYVTCTNDHRRQYRPTMHLVALAGQILANTDFVQAARPHLAQISSDLDAATELVVPSYESVLCVLRCEPGGEVGEAAVKEVVGAQSCAGGRVLLAGREAWRANVLGGLLRDHGRLWPAERSALEDDLRRIAQEGFAIVQARDGAPRTIAAPVRVDGEVVAALQIRREGLRHEDASTVTRAASDLSRSLYEERTR